MLSIHDEVKVVCLLCQRRLEHAQAEFCAPCADMLREDALEAKAERVAAHLRARAECDGEYESRYLDRQNARENNRRIG